MFSLTYVYKMHFDLDMNLFSQVICESKCWFFNNFNGTECLQMFFRMKRKTKPIISFVILLLSFFLIRNWKRKIDVESKKQ